MTDTANLGLPCIEGNQAQKHVTHNDALRILDTLVQLAVLDRDLTAPPGSPADGARWIVKSGATGPWAGHADAIASWQGGAWQFSEPNTGWLAYVVDESALVAWDGSAWVPAIDAVTPTTLNNMTLLGVGTTADATNPLSAKFNNALFVAKTVAEGGDGDLRYKLSKEGAGNTLSFLFQDNYSDRAEIGLTGDDDFHFKVSPDGSTWRDAIVIDKSSGQVSFPQGGASTDLELTLAELTLGVADALNTAQFIGSAGNRFADSFDALTYVDTGAAVNLDSGTAGLLKPSASSVSTISGATGTAFTDANSGGDASLAFNGVTGLPFTGSASDLYKAAATAMYVGKDYSAEPQRISYAVVYGANDAGFVGGYSGSVTLYLYGKNGSAPSYGTDGTLLGSVTFADSISAQTVNSSDAATAWDYVWIYMTQDGGANAMIVVEVMFYAPAAVNNLVVASTALAAVSAPSTARLVARVKEVDSIALNTDLLFSVSRDGGTTYSAFTMTKKFTANAIAVYESDSLDISDQPSGADMTWKAVSANNKSFELHDIYLYWS